MSIYKMYKMNYRTVGYCPFFFLGGGGLLRRGAYYRRVLISKILLLEGRSLERSSYQRVGAHLIIYGICLFKCLGVYLILGLLAAAFISEIKIKENEIICQFKK